MVEHTDEGAMGVVLNRPDRDEVAEAVPELADLADPEDVIHAGGPVEPDAVIALGDFEEPDEAGTPMAGSLGLLDPERDRPRAAAPARVRRLCRMGAWAARRRSSRTRPGSSARCRADDPFADEDLWPAVLQRKGGAYALLATMPADPTLN